MNYKSIFFKSGEAKSGNSPFGVQSKYLEVNNKLHHSILKGIVHVIRYCEKVYERPGKISLV